MAQTFAVSVAMRGAASIQGTPASGGGGGHVTNGMIFDLDAETQSGSDGTQLSPWTDSGPNAYEFISSGANRPYISNSISVLNNKKGMVFTRSVPTYYSKSISTNVLPVTNYTVIAVIVAFDGANSANEELLHFSKSAAQTIQFNANTGNNKVGWYDGSFHEPAANTVGAQILSWQLDSTGTSGAIFRNGTQIGSSLAYTQKDCDNFFIGIYQNVSANAFNGIIARLECHYLLSASDRLSEEKYLGAIYGITVP
jgi:hypothetical protein